jgi:thiol-disulfide isomerase/thioredoxin
MTRTYRYLAPVFLVSYIVYLWQPWAGQGSLPAIGSVAPDISLPLLSSKTKIKISEQKGKVVVLDFWATWCAPCKRTWPHLQTLHEHFPKEKVAIFAVDQDSISEDQSASERNELVQEFVKKNNYTVPVLMDFGQAQKAYGVNKLPSYIVIDAQGFISKTNSGIYFESTLRSDIEFALGSVQK